MPAGLQAFAEHQPVTAAVDAMRALVLGGPWGAKALETLAWSAGIVIVFGYLAVRRYRRAVWPSTGGTGGGASHAAPTRQPVVIRAGRW